MLKIHLGKGRFRCGFLVGGFWIWIWRADVGIELSSRETSERQSLWPVGEG